MDMFNFFNAATGNVCLGAADINILLQENYHLIIKTSVTVLI
jgi:hypothetical protein